MPGARSADDGGDVVDRAHDRRDAVRGRSRPSTASARRPACRSSSTAARRWSSPPAAAPSGTKNDAVSIAVAPTIVQNDSMLRRGNAMSRAPIMQRDAEVAEAADQDRRDREEDHDRAVHREQRRVRRRRDHAARRREQQLADQRHRLARVGELPADQHRHQAADGQERQARGTGTACRSPCDRSRRRAPPSRRRGVASARSSSTASRRRHRRSPSPSPRARGVGRVVAQPAVGLGARQPGAVVVLGRGDQPGRASCSG